MRGLLLHSARWGLLAVIVLAIHFRHAQLTRRPVDQQDILASLEQVQSVLPSATAWGAIDDTHQGRFIQNAQGEQVGFVVETSPSADRIIGYSGPNNVLLVFDTQANLQGAVLLSSGDTSDHVAKIRANPAFLEKLKGKTWQELAQMSDVDGVTGATLTSIAILQGIITRLDGAPPNLLFPDPPTLALVQDWFPSAASITPGRDSAESIVKDANGETLGILWRTSPGTDKRLGYQGPTDGLLALDPQARTIIGIGINKSYDNTRYVEDVQMDWSMHRFKNMPLEDFAGLTVGRGEDLEGVSGATMTSQTLFRNLIDTAADRLAPPPAPPVNSVAESPLSPLLVWFRAPQFRLRDYLIIAFILGGLLLAFTNLRGRASVRRTWQLVLVLYLGLISGDFVSQALLVGWSRNGLPWRIAPGLVLLTLAAFLVPFATKTQLYCHHLCPHGAAQELVKRRLPWQWRIPAWLERPLSTLPAALLVFVLATALVPLSVNLASIEPFDAYVWHTAGWITITIAIVGLLTSLFVPMAYCRYGCPTGALLGYLRRNARSDRLTRQDLLAALLAAIGLLSLVSRDWLPLGG